MLAIDSMEERVQLIADSVTEAMCFDVTDAAALQRTSPERRDVCLCAIGDDAREAGVEPRPRSA